jgi:hypothetical protein
MRKTIALIVLLIGILPALLALEKDWGTRFVMMCVGLMFSGPVAWVIAWLGKGNKHTQLNCRPSYDQMGFELPEQELTPTTMSSTYYSPDGHLPYAKPSQAQPDLHQFDPQNLTWPHD